MKISFQYHISSLLKGISLTLIILLISCTTAPKYNYEGELNDDGLYHGKGVITYPLGGKYVGEFKDGKRDGQGVHTYPSGSKYVGEFKDGKYNGQGTITHPDGEQYVGEYKDGKRDGQGAHTYPSGSKYVGEFKDGKYNGQGTFTYPDDSKYVGEYKDGIKNGLGTYTFPSGEKYVGEFKDGKYTGKGALFKVNGEIKYGTFSNDIFLKNWTIEAIDNFLRNKYPQFTGLNYSTPITSVSLQRNEVYFPPQPYIH